MIRDFLGMFCTVELLTVDPSLVSNPVIEYSNNKSQKRRV